MDRIKVKSPTGMVHYADFKPMFGFEHEWKETDEPVTCERCLKIKLLGQLRDTKFHARIIHNDVRRGVELTLEYAKGNLLRILVSQGYIKKIPKKGEQIEITIWGEI